jgi:hypothetical protein
MNSSGGPDIHSPVGGIDFVSVKEYSIPVAMPLVEIYTDGGCEPNPGPGREADLFLP